MDYVYYIKLYYNPFGRKHFIEKSNENNPLIKSLKKINKTGSKLIQKVNKQKLVEKQNNII